MAADPSAVVAAAAATANLEPGTSVVADYCNGDNMQPLRDPHIPVPGIDPDHCALSESVQNYQK